MNYLKQKLRSVFGMRTFSCIVLIAFLNSLTACSYYRIRTLEPNPRKSDNPVIQKNIEESAYYEIKKGILSEKYTYVVLHQGKNVWHLKDISIDKEKGEINGSIEAVTENHKYYLKAHRGVNRYKPEYGNPTNDVQLYSANMDFNVDSSAVSIPVTAVSKIEFYKKDRGATAIRAVLVAVPSFLVLSFALLYKPSKMNYSI